MKTAKFQPANSPKIESTNSEALLDKIIQIVYDMTSTAEAICHDKGFIVYRVDREFYTSLSIAKTGRIDEPQPILRITDYKDAGATYTIDLITLQEILDLITV